MFWLSCFVVGLLRVSYAFILASPCASRSSVLFISAKTSVEETKVELYNTIQQPNAGDRIRVLVDQLSSIETDESTWINGEWELLYCTEDDTRSSPFFTAFRNAFPESADQIYGITDAIPYKTIGPVSQEITSTNLVSRVRVETLGGTATSIMTTRCTILPAQQQTTTQSAYRTLQVDTTKPEESTILKTLLGESLAETVSANFLPPFPSGRALEQVKPGSSLVIWKNPFCDEALRISQYGEKSDDFCVWKRKKFDEYETL